MILLFSSLGKGFLLLFFCSVACTFVGTGTLGFAFLGFDELAKTELTSFIMAAFSDCVNVEDVFWLAKVDNGTRFPTTGFIIRLICALTKLLINSGIGDVVIGAIGSTDAEVRCSIGEVIICDIDGNGPIDVIETVGAIAPTDAEVRCSIEVVIRYFMA